jgi:hypothetical protein
MPIEANSEKADRSCFKNGIIVKIVVCFNRSRNVQKLHFSIKTKVLQKTDFIDIIHFDNLSQAISIITDN